MGAALLLIEEKSDREIHSYVRSSFLKMLTVGSHRILDDADGIQPMGYMLGTSERDDYSGAHLILIQLIQ